MSVHYYNENTSLQYYNLHLHNSHFNQTNQDRLFINYWGIHIIKGRARRCCYVVALEFAFHAVILSPVG